MKVSEFFITHKVPIAFAIFGIITTFFAILLFFKVLNPKPYYLKWYCAIISGLALMLTGLITVVFDKSSSDKSSQILGNTSESIEKLNSLQIENLNLRQQIIKLQDEQIQKNRDILELGEQNLKRSNENLKLGEINKIIIKNIEALSGANNKLGGKILHLNEIIQNLNTGGASFPNLGHCRISLFDKRVQKSGDRLHVLLELFNNGDFALDKIKIKGYQVNDFRKVDPVFLWTELSMSGLNIHSRFANMSKEFQVINNKQNPPLFSSDYEVLKSGQLETIGPIQFKEPFEYYGLNIFVESKRQDWIILLRLHMPNNSIEPFVFQAHKVMKVTATGLENVIEKIEPGFPIGADNRFIWFSSELPKEWFSKVK